MAAQQFHGFEGKSTCYQHIATGASISEFFRYAGTEVARRYKPPPEHEQFIQALPPDKWPPLFNAAVMLNLGLSSGIVPHDATARR
jgi:hypothetical protein